MGNGPTEPNQGLTPGGSETLSRTASSCPVSETLLSSHKPPLQAVTHALRDSGKVKLALGETDEITCS